MGHLIESGQGSKPTNIHFVPGTKFFTPIFESLITLGKRWTKINLGFVWGGKGRRSREPGGAGSGMMPQGKIVLVQGKDRWVTDALTEAGEETREQ